MTDIHNMVNAVKKMVRQVQPLIDLGELLEQVGSLEQVYREAASKMEVTQASLKVCEVDLINLNDQCAEADSKRLRISQESEEMEIQIKSASAAIINTARQKAQTMLSDANNEVDKVAHDTELGRIEHASFMAHAGEEEGKLRKRLDTLKQQLADIKERL